jgi:hypothetical protein
MPGSSSCGQHPRNPYLLSLDPVVGVGLGLLPLLGFVWLRGRKVYAEMCDVCGDVCREVCGEKCGEVGGEVCGEVEVFPAEWWGLK